MAWAATALDISGSLPHRSAGETAALVLRRVFLGGSPSHLQPHRQALSSAWVRRKLPAAPATVILSIVVHFLQWWSFISSRTETHAGRSAHGTERHAHGSSPGRRETSSPAPQLPRASAPGHRAHQRHEMKLCTCGSSRQETTRTDSGLGRGDFSQLVCLTEAGLRQVRRGRRRFFPRTAFTQWNNATLPFYMSLPYK